MGIGPTYLPWEGNALPLSYGRLQVYPCCETRCGASIPTAWSMGNQRPRRTVNQLPIGHCGPFAEWESMEGLKYQLHPAKLCFAVEY